MNDQKNLNENLINIDNQNNQLDLDLNDSEINDFTSFKKVHLTKEEKIARKNKLSLKRKEFKLKILQFKNERKNLIVERNKKYKVYQESYKKQLNEKLKELMNQLTNSESEEDKQKIHKEILQTKKNIKDSFNYVKNLAEVLEIRNRIKFLKKEIILNHSLLKDKDPDLVFYKNDFKDENIFEVNKFNLWYKNGSKQALKNININLKKNKVTALIGPSGCGKSTFIRSLNKMNDLIDGVKTKGDIWFLSKNINSQVITELELRTRVGMVFQKPTPFNLSIYENIAYALRSHGIKEKSAIDKIVEESLKAAALWEEVKNILDENALSLSGGQQQRLCIARAIALQPDVLLMDEPTSALDPVATNKIEILIRQLKQRFSIVIVTHSMAQAQRVSDETIFFFQGVVIESGPTKQIFTQPKEKRTKDYVSGRIG